MEKIRTNLKIVYNVYLTIKYIERKFRVKAFLNLIEKVCDERWIKRIMKKYSSYISVQYVSAASYDWHIAVKLVDRCVGNGLRTQRGNLLVSVCCWGEKYFAKQDRSLQSNFIM